MDEHQPFDIEITTIMDHLFNIIRPAEKTLSDVELRCLVAASNLRGLAEAMLVADDNSTGIDLKRTALGLFGTADWLKRDIEPTSEKVELQ